MLLITAPENVVELGHCRSAVIKQQIQEIFFHVGGQHMTDLFL